MSKAKWFAVRKQEIIATSANQIVPPEMLWTYKNVVLGGLGMRLPTTKRT